jgi:phospho-N-acetylmuramoyl-pentapeptide-transferase
MIPYNITPQQLQQIFLFVSTAFLIAFLLTPVLTEFLFKNKVGKRLRQHGTDGKATPIFSQLHKDKAGTPTMGGLLFWVTTAIITILFNLNRGETYLPVFALVVAGIIGAVDDVLNVQGKGHNGGGLRLLHKFPIYLLLAGVGAWWFYYKLGWNTIYNPFDLSFLGLHSLVPGYVGIGWLYVPLFICTVLFVGFSMNQTDGLDGLAAGVSLIACLVFTLLALLQGKVHIALFCATLLGSLLAFLWFNINPARFFMGDTGSFALGMVLPVLAFLTNSVLVLPLILIIPYLEGISTIIQIFSKKFFKRKVFLVAPIHHHFEALGWPETKVTMRFWVISAMGTSVALLIMLTSR